MPDALTVDRRAVLHAIDTVAERLITTVLAAPDPGLRVPASPQWTVAEAFAHVVTVAPRYRDGARQAGEWAESVPDLAHLNARQITRLGTTDLRQLAATLRADLGELADVIDGLGDEQPVFRFHGGEKIAADTALGILLGELVVHGHDIAAVLRMPWPIDPAHVELIMRGVAPILPGWVHPTGAAGHTGRYEIRLRGQGVHRYAFRDGRLWTNPDDGFRPDTVISADPATALLVLYRRRSQWPAILTGRLLAYGRRPWLALRFTSRFYHP
jgi:uncharacterized protein (TIGR03083 family)